MTTVTVNPPPEMNATVDIIGMPIDVLAVFVGCAGAIPSALNGIDIYPTWCKLIDAVRLSGHERTYEKTLSYVNRREYP